MVDVNDDTDFNKARGFLLTYSGIILALWFFGAKLTDFKLMGTEIHLEHRTNSVWMVLACLNVYFWFRCYQRLPDGGFYFDKPMNDLYDKAIGRLTIPYVRRQSVQAMHKEFAKVNDGNQQAVLNSVRARILCHDWLDQAEMQNNEEVPELHQVSRIYRTTLRIEVHYRYTQKGEWVQFGHTAFIDEYVPPAPLTWFAKLLTLLKGAFVTPWFTDHIAPLLLGFASTSVSFCMWWQINYGSTPAIGQ
jgi:hypothetical protein